MNILMFDHDPVAAARAHCDKDVVQAILDAAQLLSTAWHELDNAQYKPLADDPADDPVTPWLEMHVEPPTTGKEQRTTPRQSVAPGEAPYFWWLLHKQRIYTRSHDWAHPSAVWTRELGGNYLWLWRLGVALCTEFKHRYGKHHRTEPVLWTLEAVPPSLLETVGQWSECPPVAPAECLVVVDGFYDTVASYRAFYQHKADTAQYTNRDPPEWMT